MGLTLILGHSNMDPDCLGSIVLARYLHPGAIAIRSSRMHPFANRLYSMYADELDFRKVAEFKGQQLDCLIVVDTRSKSQLKEYFESAITVPAEMVVYDHHPHGDDDLQGTQVFHKRYGSNCSVMCEELKQAGIRVSSDDATIALAGVYTDTGNFLHDNVHAADYEAAAYLLSCGASIHIVHKLTHRLPDDNLMSLLHELLSRSRTMELSGHRVVLSEIDLIEQPTGLSLVAERLHEIEGADATFAIFSFERERSHLIVARSASPSLDVAFVLSMLGGGGHPQAASVLLHHTDEIPVMDFLQKALALRLKPALKASEIMTINPPVLRDTWTLMEASIVLESYNLSGAVVQCADGKIVGMLSLRDIQKGRKAGAMKSPVRAYMVGKVVSILPDASLHEIELAFLHNDVSRLPVVQENTMLGILYRSDCMKR